MNEPTISEWKTLIKYYRLQKSGINNEYFSNLMRAPNMRAYYPISRTQVEQYSPKKRISLTDKDILTGLKIAGFTSANLDKNLVSNEKDKVGQYRKIGRVLTSLGYSNMEKYFKKRNNSKFNENSDYSLVISAHPYDILRASYKRSWSSCLNPEKRFHYIDLLYGVCSSEHCAMVVYLINSKDRAIKKPLGRTFLNGYAGTVYRTPPSINIYGYDASNGFRSEVAATIFDASCDFYGKFPQFFKHKLSEIVKTEVNKNSPLCKNHKLTYGVEECTYYVDNNNESLYGGKDLRSFNRPPKSSSPWINIDSNISIKKMSSGMPHYPTIGDVIKGGPENINRFNYFSPHSTSSSMYPTYIVYKLLKANKITPELVDNFINYSKLKLHQMYNLLTYHPRLIKCDILMDAIKARGKPFEDLVKYFTK